MGHVRVEARAVGGQWPCDLAVARVPRLCKKTRPVWPANWDQAADWLRLAEARGGREHDLALKEASGEPAGRVVSQLIFYIVPRPDVARVVCRCGQREGLEAVPLGEEREDRLVVAVLLEARVLPRWVPRVRDVLAARCPR